MRTATGDIFSVLPAPILEQVLLDVWDLPSLHSLYRASFTVYSLLHEDGVGAEIMEVIMARTSIPSIRILIRKVADLRCNAASIPSIDAFISRYILDQATFYRDREINDTGYPPLPRNLPGSVACHILSLAGTAYYLAHAGMHEMIDRCMALELYQMQDPHKRYLRGANTPKKPYFPRPKTDRERYQQEDVGPPFWVKEQRAIRAVWQVWLVWELYLGLSNPQVSTNWSAAELQRLQNMEIGDFWAGIRYSCIEQVRTMMQCKCLYPELASPVERFYAALSLARSEQWACSFGCRPWPLSAIDRWAFVDFQSVGYSFAMGYLSVSHDSPCRYVSFSVFRPYGFALWARRRMEAWGLNDDREMNSRWRHLHPRSRADAFFRWESILSPEELEEIERRRKHYWPGIERIHIGHRTG